jgi:hypothetical protein
MRSAGGVLLAVGALVLLSRKSGHGQWGTFAQLLVVLVPAVVLYALALARSPARAPAEPDQTVLAVSAILLSPVVLLEFLRWIGASTNSALNLAAVFAVAALLAAYTVRRSQVTYAALLGGLSALAAWLLVWSKILDHPSADTYRWLLIAGAAILFCVAAALSLADANGSSEVATAGGLAAIAAGIIGVVVSGVLGALSVVTASSSRSGERTSLLRPVHHLSGAQHLGWDVYLLVASVALVWIGSRVRSRGLGYVGGLGLFAFLVSVLAQLTRVQSGHGRTSHIVGWPLVLVLVGAAGIVGGTRGRARPDRG